MFRAFLLILWLQREFCRTMRQFLKAHHFYPHKENPYTCLHLQMWTNTFTGKIFSRGNSVAKKRVVKCWHLPPSWSSCIPAHSRVSVSTLLARHVLSHSTRPMCVVVNSHTSPGHGDKYMNCRRHAVEQEVLLVKMKKKRLSHKSQRDQLNLGNSLPRWEN